MIIYSEIMPMYQLFSKTIFLLKRETPFCSTIHDLFIGVAVRLRNTIAINKERCSESLHLLKRIDDEIVGVVNDRGVQ